MNPEVGRFVSRDPWEGVPDLPNTLHKYMYSGMNPVMYADPSGLTWMSISETSLVQGLQSQLKKCQGQLQIRVTLKKTGCIVIEQSMDEIITSGIYIFADAVGAPPYVGMTTRKIETRITEHGRKLGQVLARIGFVNKHADGTLRQAEQYILERVLEALELPLDKSVLNSRRGSGDVLNKIFPGGEGVREFVKKTFKMCP